MSDRYILYCPKCGKVEGYVPSELTEEEGDLEPDVGVIEQEAVETNSGPAQGGYAVPSADSG